MILWFDELNSGGGCPSGYPPLCLSLCAVFKFWSCYSFALMARPAIDCHQLATSCSGYCSCGAGHSSSNWPAVSHDPWPRGVSRLDLLHLALISTLHMFEMDCSPYQQSILLTSSALFLVNVILVWCLSGDLFFTCDGRCPDISPGRMWIILEERRTAMCNSIDFISRFFLKDSLFAPEAGGLGFSSWFQGPGERRWGEQWGRRGRHGRERKWVCISGRAFQWWACQGELSFRLWIWRGVGRGHPLLPLLILTHDGARGFSDMEKKGRSRTSPPLQFENKR